MGIFPYLFHCSPAPEPADGLAAVRTHGFIGSIMSGVGSLFVKQVDLHFFSRFFYKKLT